MAVFAVVALIFSKKANFAQFEGNHCAFLFILTYNSEILCKFGVECWHFNIVPSKDDDNVVGSIHCAVDGFDDFEGEPTKNKKLSEILAMLDLKLNKYTGVNGKASKNGKETTWTTDKLTYSLTWNSSHAKAPETNFEYDHINIYLDITPNK